MPPDPESPGPEQVTCPVCLMNLLRSALPDPLRQHSLDLPALKQASCSLCIMPVTSMPEEHQQCSV